jgi:hypothetical protein
LSTLLRCNKVDIAIVTETKLPSADILINGYVLFLPPPSTTAKFRVIVLVTSLLATSAIARIWGDVMSDLTRSVWVELEHTVLPHPSPPLLRTGWSWWVASTGSGLEQQRSSGWLSTPWPTR